jgi:hypothetical protein
MPLADDITVYPAHGAGSACGKNMSKETFDSLGNQKRTNYALRADMTKEEFISACKNYEQMTIHWVQPVIVDLVVYLNDRIKGFEFPEGAKDLKEKYPQTFDSILDFMARCITISDEDFRQIISFK